MDGIYISLYVLSLGLAFLVSSRPATGGLMRWARAPYEHQQAGRPRRMDLPDGERIFGPWADRSWELRGLESFDTPPRRRVVVQIHWRQPQALVARFEEATRIAQVFVRRLKVDVVAVEWDTDSPDPGILIMAPDLRGWLGQQSAPLVSAQQGEHVHVASVVSAFGDSPAHGLFVPPLPVMDALTGRSSA